jgi:hypothetical protein
MANSTAPICIKPTVAFNRGDTFVFGAWVCTADGAGSFQRRLTMSPNPETGFVTLPEVVTGELAGKFGEISLFDQHADFELRSASNSNSTSPWAIACEPATQPSHVVSPPREPASGLVITSTPAGRFIYWPDRKPADLISGDSRYVAYLDSLPFQEGTPLTRADSYTPTEVASSDSSLGNPDRQVFMAAGDTPGTSGTAQDKYLEDISADELSAEAPADETDANRDARREHNRKRNERRRRLRDNLPIRNLAEALEAVESRVHTTPEQCLMSITAIARQAQGIRAREVIAKLAEDTYFMRVDNRVTQPPPVRNRDNEATSRSADLGRNRTRAELPAQPNRTRANAGGPSQTGNSAAAAGGDRQIIPHCDPDGGGSVVEAPTMEPIGGPVAEAVAAVETT